MGRIDTHFHVIPPDYAAWLRGQSVEAGGLMLPDWSRESALATMDRFGIETAILSVSTPGVHLGDDGEARAWARAVNEFAAEVVRSAPDRFGFFATLCLPDLDGSLDELAHAFDRLGADGVVLLANSRGVYLGDRVLDPSSTSSTAGMRVSSSILRICTATSRCAGCHLRRRLPARHHARRHSPGRIGNARALPQPRDHPVARRRVRALRGAPVRRVRLAATRPADGIEQLRKFYFDTALSGSPIALDSLLAFARPGHVLYGCDWPYAPAPRSTTSRPCTSRTSPTARRASIDREAAEALFPRLGGRPWTA